ncbi:MAG: SufS family cysteine desulfurase [Acidobacteria bacterium]|nr:SufS family cysteine desulfurase [Acidobacteriota bacterium]
MLERFRKDFPVLENNPGLTYLDSAASTQKPAVVLEKTDRFYRFDYANIHRGIYRLSERATASYEAARKRIAEFIGAAAPESIVYTRNATESLNLIAATMGEQAVQKGDEIVVTVMEHHANFVPWQQLAAKKGAILKVVGLDRETLELDMTALESAVTGKTRFICCTMASNVLGTTPDMAEVTKLAKKSGALTVFDAAQFVPHHKLDISTFDPDFLVLSGHKMLALDGFGILYGKPEHLAAMPPYMTGGDMIENVTIKKTTYAEPPQKFEAGTPFMGGAVSLHAAIDYLENIGFDRIQAHETRLAKLADEKFRALGKVKLYRKPDRIHNGILPFNVEGVHPHDVATILGDMDICVRAGHHCAQPLIRFMDEMAMVRASFYIYNTEEDVDRLIAGVKKTLEVFHK